MSKHVYSTSSVVTGQHGAVGIGRISGVVTALEARRIIIDSPRWGLRPLAHLADYSQAAVAIDTAALMGSAIEAQRHGVVLAPTAIVVGPDQMPMFAEYCRASMAAGLLKAAFLNVEDALRWAGRQAAVREHWLKLRGEMRSIQ
jgi:hypothetical protein